MQLVNRMNTYNLNAVNKEKESNTIKHILYHNKYDLSILNSFSKTQNNRKPNKTKWAKFTYVGRETKFITKLFNDSSVKIAFTTQNTIGKLLSSKQNPHQNQFESSGFYQSTCPDCSTKYVGQKDRPFRLMFQQYFRDFKYANNQSKFAQHLVDNSHSIGPIESLMNVLNTTIKGRLLDTMERFYIYNETRKNNQINDKNTAKSNIIYETIIREDTSRVHTTA